MMERNEFLKMCQRVSIKMKQSGGWLGTAWDTDDLVRWDGALYVPISYILGFDGDKPTHTAVIRDIKAGCCVIHALLSDVSIVSE